MNAEDNPLIGLIATIQMTNVEMFRLLDEHGVLPSQTSADGLRERAHRLPDETHNRELIALLLTQTADIVQSRRPADIRTLLQVIDGGRTEPD